ncbi:MAG: hypothetical protein WA778_21660, partial [Pseudolabrys sp.]
DKNRTPKLDRVILIPTPDASARVAGLLGGYLNFIEAPPPEANATLKAAGITIKTNSYPHIWPYIYRIAGDNTPFNLDAAVGRPLPALRRTSQPRMVASGRQ